MATLDRWLHFLEVPQTLAFPKLELIGRDFSPPIVVGRGEVLVPTLTSFEYVLQGVPEDIPYAEAAFRRQQQDPYDELARFRLVGTDAHGVEWTLGWTVPDVQVNANPWHLSGHLQGLSPRDGSESVSKRSETELIFVVPRAHPIAIAFMRFADRVAGEGSAYGYSLEILGSTIRFSYDAIRGALSITAAHSHELPPTHTENWLGEPLRILFGQLIYPRLVARNLGGGRTHVFVRPSPSLQRRASWVALWNSEHPIQSQSAFWSRYAELLTLIARARDRKGHPNFEANKITLLYEEVIQSSHGTRWVWALTFASSIEGLVDMLGVSAPRDDVSDDKKQALIDHIKNWSGDDRLRQSAINAVHRASKVSTVDVLRGLIASGALTKRQFDAWYELRNSVMHGNLVSPYSSEDEDRKLIDLVEALHALTREVLKRSAGSGKTCEG